MMRARYLIWNPTDLDVVLASGEKIAPDGFGTKIYLRDEMFAIFNELDRKGLRPCLIRPCVWQEYTASDSVEARQGSRAQLPASRRQHEHYILLTSESLPPGTTRLQASDAIDKELEEDKRRAEEEEAKAQKRQEAAKDNLPTSSPSKTASDRRAPRNLQLAGEVLPGLKIIDEDNWDQKLLKGVTVLIDLTAARLQHESKDLFHLHWPADNYVDAKVLEGVIRLCSSASQGIKQRVLVVGSDDAIQLIAACALRESFGIDAKSALAILRGLCTRAVRAKEVLSSIEGYRVS